MVTFFCRRAAYVRAQSPYTHGCPKTNLKQQRKQQNTFFVFSGPVSTSAYYLRRCLLIVPCDHRTYCRVSSRKHSCMRSLLTCIHQYIQHTVLLLLYLVQLSPSLLCLLAIRSVIHQRVCSHSSLQLVDALEFIAFLLALYDITNERVLSMHFFCCPLIMEGS